MPLSSAADRDASKGVVLMRDEDRRLNEVVADFLEAMGWRVVALDASSRAMTWWAAREQPTVAVLDVESLTSQNCNLLARLMMVVPPLPVIVLTGFGDLPSARWAEELGAHVIERPFDLEDLGSVLQSFEPRR